MGINTNWSGTDVLDSDGKFKPWSECNPRPKPKKLENTKENKEADNGRASIAVPENEQ